MSDKPVIFISYSHKDEPDKLSGSETWLTYIQSHLQPAVKGDIFDLWTDHDIDGGDDWRAAIDKKLNGCDIFILLVSRHSVSSDFICGVEVDRMLARRRDSEIAIYPIVLSPFATSAVPWLMELNLVPREGKPLSTFGSADRDLAMVEIVEEIAAKAKEIAQKKKTLKSSAPIRVRTTDLAAKLRNEARVTSIDITHLPETAYENLVGRALEMKRLDQAWADPNTNILSLIAEGGAGKSALVNDWLTRLRADNYRGAESVLGWSFYSQGTKERATSAEQFLNWAIAKLGIRIETTSATAKGEAIAEEMMKHHVLLVLDGCEPLQHGLDKQQGELKDLGLRALLRRFASTPPTETHGLVVLTSRLPVKDIARWKGSAAPVVNVEQLSEEAGAALLRDNGVWGPDRQLQAAAADFDGHPLALALLASFLKETQFGDVRRRDHVRAYFADPESPRHDHAKRVMESYEKEWLSGQPVLLAIMYLVGLFDRPAGRKCLFALRKMPVIVGLTDDLIGVDENKWRRAIAWLQEARLLSPRDFSESGELDAHPLVREWFGNRLKQKNEMAWNAAHSRLYEHLRDTTKEGKTPTLEDLAPLYQAIAHGCRAGRHQEALDEIYRERICRWDSEGRIELYASSKLGASSIELTAISWFFEKPYEVPVATLTTPALFWVLSMAAFSLRAQGRFAEALPAMRIGFSREQAANDWRNLATTACNISEVERLVGEIDVAVATGEQAVIYADRGGNKFEMLAFRATYADALHAAGRREEAKLLFADAERRQKELQPGNPLLYALQGFQYCDLLLENDEYAAHGDRVKTTIVIARRNNWLLDIGLDTLTLGRVHFGLALKNVGTQYQMIALREETNAAQSRFDEAVDGLRASGVLEFLARGLLARAAFRRSVGDSSGATRDFDEVEEIAEPGPMKLDLCDLALERSRLAFAKIEAFAPLNGLIDDSPPKPVAPDAAEAAHLKAVAAKQLAIAADYIKTCGYHRRDEELAELQAVQRGERKFADLPPRV